MALLRWIIGFIIAILAAAFAVFNRQSIDINWNPAAPPLQAPLYIVVLAATAAGFLIGALMVWMNMIQFRFDASRHKRHIKKLEQELEETEKPEEPAAPTSKFLPPFLNKKRA